MSKDQTWKRVIEKFFSKFTEFFLPELHNDIDFNYKPKFLDNELLKISQKSGSKNRASDKLVEIKLKDGTDRCILVHIEVQDSKKDDFIFRMFQYHKEFYGTEISYKFNTYKILDQKDKKEELKNNDNPFALVILASLYYLESKTNENKRYNFKIELTKLLLDKGYKKKDIWELFDFIDVLMSFSNEKLEEKYYEEIEKMPKVKEKEIIGGFKKIAMKKNSIEIAKIMKFKNEPINKIVEYTGLTIEEIEKL